MPSDTLAHMAALTLAEASLSAPDHPAGLESLCLAAVAEAAAKLRPGLVPTDCAPAFVSACALLALAGLAAREAALGGGVNSFRLGAVSVSAGRAGDAAARAETLRREADRLLAPYAAPTGFAFLGVDG
ncbi:MAG: hypothetical protein LBT60_04945 [Oscillospiraceae bacterium]|jgi:hypothetical protein|nr:hypothetical protein [Oscillospiraceae bacterium]